jgi:hypothetical protein
MIMGTNESECFEISKLLKIAIAAIPYFMFLKKIQRKLVYGRIKKMSIETLRMLLWAAMILVPLSAMGVFRFLYFFTERPRNYLISWLGILFF